ncbi:MAG: hypothetical protein KGL48_12875 [Sphingomonadales bacterium]|nr:hypothetical protein [Sphingomonadales bacterium]MDE2570318.1 hypothetical protein [Sphingomonadales bacterium]
MKLYSKEGVEMMDVTSIGLDGDKLVLKGKMMGAMAATIHIKPADMWAAFQLFPWAVRLRMPMLLLKGWREGRNASG